VNFLKMHIFPIGCVSFTKSGYIGNEPPLLVEGARTVVSGNEEVARILTADACDPAAFPAVSAASSDGPADDASEKSGTELLPAPRPGLRLALSG